MTAEQISSDTQLVDSVESALRADRRPYNPDAPDEKYRVPRTDIKKAEQKLLMETSLRKPGGRLGSPEGWVKYSEDRVLYEVINENGKLCLIKERFPLHEHELWTFPSKSLRREGSLDELNINATQVSESFASIKYHDLRTIVARTTDLSVLEGKEVMEIECTREGLTAFLTEHGRFVDPSIVSALYRLHLRMEGHTVPSQLPVLRDKYAGNPVQREMQTTTGNWFQFIMIDENGNDVEMVVSGPESAAIAITIQGYILLMRELSPMTGRNELIAVSGGVKTGEDPFDASVREMEEEIKRTGTPTREISTMSPIPFVFTGKTHVFVIPNPVGYRGEAVGDEVTPTELVAVHRDELPELIKNGVIIDDRTLASLVLALNYADQHPEIFL